MPLRVPSSALPDPPTFAEFLQDVDLVGGYFQVFDAAAAIELVYGFRGQREVLETVVLNPGSYSLARSPAGKPLRGVRGQNAVAGSQSTVTGYFWDETSPAISFVGVATPGTLSTGAMQVISDQILAAAAADILFSGIPQTYRHLLLRLAARGDFATSGLTVHAQYNGDTGANYSNQILAVAAGVVTPAENIGTATMRIGRCPGSTAPASSFGTLAADLSDYASTTHHKAITALSASRETAAGGGMIIEQAGGVWFSAAAIASIRLFLGAGNFEGNTRATLYGLEGV